MKIKNSIMNLELEMIDKASRESRWLERNFNSLQEKYENKFIAVENEEVIEESDDFQDLLNKLNKKGKNPALLIIRFIHQKGISIIL